MAEAEAATALEADNARLCKEWRGLVELAGEWAKSSNQGGGLFEVARDGEAGGFFVSLGAYPERRAYLKPLKRQPAHRRAAREKIAADLACEVGLCVPPVLLTENGKTTDAERFAAVSLVMYPIQISWGAIDDRLARGEPAEFAPMLPRLPTAASHALAFDTWVGQSDHISPSNIVFGFESGRAHEGRLVFLDYAYSQGIFGGWDNANHLK